MSIIAQPTETPYPLTAANLGPFSTVWRFEQAGDVRVLLDEGDGGVVALESGVDYALTAPTPLTTGGTVLLSADLLTAGAWPAGARLVLQRVQATDQPSTYGQGMGFSPLASEQALDHVAREVQQLASKLTRALLLSPGESLAAFPGPAGRILMYLATDGAGNLGFFNAPTPALPGTIVATAALLRAEVTFDGKACLMQTYAGVTGSGGLFYFSAASMASEDNGLVIRPAAIGLGSPGRWLRDLGDTPWVDLKWYGADPTGTAYNDILFAPWIAAAMAAQLPAKASVGRYKFASQNLINLRPVQFTGLEVFGDGGGQTIFDFRGVATYPNFGAGVPADLARDGTGTLITRAFDYFKIHSMSVWSDQPGHAWRLGFATDGNDGGGQVIQIGQAPTVAAYGYVDYCNDPQVWDFHVDNFNTTTACRAVDINNVVVSERMSFNANGGSGGLIGGLGTAVRINNCTDVKFGGSWGSAQYAVEIDGGFNEGLDFQSVDMENVKTDVRITINCQAVNAIRFSPSQWSYSSWGIDPAFAFATNIMIADPHINPAPATFGLNGTLTNASAVVTAISSTDGMITGRGVTGTGVPANTTILSIDSATQITLSANATASGVNALTFAGPTAADFIRPGAAGAAAVTVRQGGSFNHLTVQDLLATTSTFTIANGGHSATFALNSANGQLLIRNVTPDAFITMLVDVVGGALQFNADIHQFSDHAGTLSLSSSAGVFTFAHPITVGASQVVSTRQTGWGAASSTLSRAAYASYAGQVMGAGYVQATAQATDDAVKALSQRVAALITDLTAHGLIGA